MAEIAHLSGRSERIDLSSVERERTPNELMELGIRFRLANFLSNTVLELDTFDVERSRKAVHDWVQKVDLQPADGATTEQVALDETVIRIDGPQYWLFAAVDYANHLEAALQRASLRFQPVRYGNRNAVEHLFREIKHRISSFNSSFSHSDPTTAETWLQAFAVWCNSRP